MIRRPENYKIDQHPTNRNLQYGSNSTFWKVIFAFDGFSHCNVREGCRKKTRKKYGLLPNGGGGGVVSEGRKKTLFWGLKRVKKA